MKEIFRVNNFDIIRLIAALQVSIRHIVFHLDIEHSGSIILGLSNFFPGVPIFFFVSGFLISKSYENNSTLKEYARNRMLRIYPALITCTIISLIIVYLTGYMSTQNIRIGEFIIWIFGQISIGQFYNPGFMGEFGVGVLNGSLWTITVELQFYIMIPIIYSVLGLAKPDGSNRKLLALILLFMTVFFASYVLDQEYEDYLLFKLFSVTFFRWIYMFLVGVYFQRNFNFFYRHLSGKVLYILPIYLVTSYVSANYFGFATGNNINPILYFLLAALVFSFAYSYSELGKNLLRGNDISYGVYIYHMPIINVLVHYGYTSKTEYALLAMMGIIMIAILSWMVVEKKCMKLKKHPLNLRDSANNANALGQ